ncbi:ENTH domain-containing protein, putative [Babesia ovata]|uniref:ENTH domain-containing protein, putative n=1 Tax=Babesia ovata TaxID=189622 RepID=A0A2H6KEI6_9APIC|nr:ENTH domain-containing protein, putative [Babesia ovata]GBE61406.1 ENTH domain-containing protein, putative [Babesia ovata]
MEGVNAANQQILLLTVAEVDKRIKEALYSNEVGCPETVLYELSQATYHAAFKERISKATWSCLKSSTPRARRIQKALTLLTYLALNGAQACTNDIITRLDDITALHDRKFPPHMRDLEIIIKDKAINLVSLVCDKQLLEKKRKEAVAIRSRFVGVASHKGHVETQMMYKPVYAVDAKAGLIGRAATEASKKWNEVFHSNREKGKSGRIREMFNLMKKNGKTGKASGSKPQQMRTLGTRTDTAYYRPDMHHNYTPGLYKGSIAEPRHHRDGDRSGESDSSDYEGSSSEEGSDSSTDSTYSAAHSRTRYRRDESGVSRLSTDSVSDSDGDYEESSENPVHGSKTRYQPARAGNKVEHYRHSGREGDLKAPWKYPLERQNNIADNMERLSLSDSHKKYQPKGKAENLQAQDRYEDSYANVRRDSYRANPFARLSHY